MNSNRLQSLGRRGTLAAGVCLSLVSGILVAPGFVASASAAPAPTGTVHVQKGGYRTGTSTVTGLAGAVFDGYKVASSSTTTVPSGAPAASCTTGAAGACDLSLPGVSGTTYVLVVERTAPAGWDRIAQFATGSSSSTSATPYVVTVTLNSGNSYTATAPGTGQSWANRLQNPALPEKCGLNIALLFDQSSSIDSGEMTQMKSAATGFVTALTGTPSKVALYTFATGAPGNNPNYALQPVQTASDAAVVTTRISGLASSGNGYTNWDQGLYQIAASSESYDVALVLTDGDPTVFHGSSTSTTVSQRNVEEAVHSANAIKKEGTKVIGVGIGMDPDSVLNLAAISGPTADSDYYTTNFANLGSTLGAIAQKSCGGTVTIEKQVDNLGNVAAANGWTFTGAITANGGSLAPASGATSTINGFDGQLTFTLTGGTWPKTFRATETAQAGYTLQGVQCYLNGSSLTSSLSGSVVSVSVGAKDAVRCVFTNVKQLITIAPPVAPVPTAPTCDVDGSLTLVDGDHFTWNGNHNLGVGTHVVTATAAAGYRFTGGATTVSYTVTVAPKTNNCPVALVAPTVVAPTCSVAGSVTLPANTAAVTYTQVQAGLSVTVTATTHAPYVFSSTAGWTVSPNRLSATYAVTVQGPTNDCPVALTTPTVNRPTCSVAGSVTAPASTDTVSYSQGQVGLVVTVTATTHAPYVFPATTGWVVSPNGLSATYTVTVQGPTNDCPVALTDPTVHEPTCSVAGFVTAPPSTSTVTYSQGSVDDVVTVTATTVAPYVLTASPGWTLSPDRRSATFTVTVLPATDECVIPAPVEPTPVDATCAVDGSLTLVDGKGYTWLGEHVLGVGTHTITAQAADGLLFPGYVTTVSYTVTVAPATHDCPAELVAPTVVPPTCTLPGYVVTPTSTDTVTYAQSSLDAVVTITATTEDPYLFSPTEGWTIAQDRLSATYSVTVAPATNECVVPVPVEPTPTAPTCSVDGSLTLVDGAGFIWDGEHVLGVGSHHITARTVEGSLFPDYSTSVSFDVVVLPRTNDCPVTPLAPTVIEPTCSVDGSVTAPANTEAITYALSQVGLDVTVTATTQAPNVIAPTEGWTIAQDRLSATYSVTVLPARNDCPVTPATPTITAQPVCTGPGTSSPGSFDLPESTDVVTYTTEGDVVTATTHAPYLFSATEGWTISEDRLTATYTVTFTSAGDCLVEVVPVLPTVAVSASCGLEGTYTIPEVEGITYLLDGEPVAADTYEGPAAGTITVTANQGYVLPDVEWSFALDLAPAEACPVIVLVTPVDPQVTQSGTCEVEGSYTVPTTAGVLYLLDGESIEAGTYPGPAAGTITAAPIEGTELVDAAWSFDLALTAAADCADSNGPLPQTGAAVTALGTVGALGLLVGVLLMVLGARRRDDETQV